MIVGRRTVVVGEGLRTGATLDEAIDRALVAAGRASVSVAVLDRADGRTALAIWIPGAEHSEPDLLDRISRELGRAFTVVSVVERERETLAEPAGLT